MVRVEFKSITGSAILGVQHATNRKNAAGQTYDAGLSKVKYSY